MIILATRTPCDPSSPSEMGAAKRHHLRCHILRTRSLGPEVLTHTHTLPVSPVKYHKTTIRQL